MYICLSFEFSERQKLSSLANNGEPRIAGGQEMTYGGSLERHLKHVGLEHADGPALAITEWATLAQDRAGWRMRVTKPPSISINSTCGSPGVKTGCRWRTSSDSSSNALLKPSSAMPSSTPRPSCNNNFVVASYLDDEKEVSALKYLGPASQCRWRLQK